MMKNIVSTSIAHTLTWFKKSSLSKVFTIVLAGFLLLSSNVGLAQNDQSLGERTRARIQQIDQNSERPKTTGEWLDEVEGDVPLGERVHNTLRDSAEAFNQFGKEYSVGAQESARNVRDKAGNAVEDFAG